MHEPKFRVDILVIQLLCKVKDLQTVQKPLPYQVLSEN